MLDVARTEAAEKELDRFINSRSKDKDKANAEAERVKAENLRRLQALREENRTLWIAHYHSLVRAHFRLARDARRRARELGEGGA